jgi:methionyl-tRNA formyltransferase
LPRIALLLDSLTVPAWVYESISLVMAEREAEIVLVVLNRHPKSSGKKSSFFYRLYRALDRRIFLQTPDAFASKKLTEIPSWEVPTLLVTPRQRRFTDEIADEDLEQIRAYRPDLIVRFGFRILKGKILTLAPMGLWSYHHGDPSVYRGGPPAFWEVMRRIPVTGVALLQLTEKLDQGPVLYQSWTQTDPLSVQRNANKLFWLSSAFLLRALRQVQQNPDQFVQLSPQKSEAPLWSPPGNWATVGLVWSLLLRTVSRKIAEWRKPAHWEIGRLAYSEGGLPSAIKEAQVEKIHPSSKQVYWADPFPISYQDKEYVLVEEFDRVKNKGSISCVLPDGSSQLILEEAWHLSYPFVWEENGKLYLLPESADAGKLYLYRSEAFPNKWVRESIFFEGEAYDPTILKKDGLYWLFVNQKAHPACSPFDELFLYFTEDIQHPHWQAHPMNPVVSDVRKSRPAGRIFEKEGKWFRPAQDSGLRYGHRVQIQEILVLTKEDYREVCVQTIEPDSDAAALGIHTLNFGEKGAWLDFYYRR